MILHLVFGQYLVLIKLLLHPTLRVLVFSDTLLDSSPPPHHIWKRNRLLGSKIAKASKGTHCPASIKARAVSNRKEAFRSWFNCCRAPKTVVVSSSWCRVEDIVRWSRRERLASPSALAPSQASQDLGTRPPKANFLPVLLTRGHHALFPASACYFWFVQGSNGDCSGTLLCKDSYISVSKESSFFRSTSIKSITLVTGKSHALIMMHMVYLKFPPHSRCSSSFSRFDSNKPPFILNWHHGSESRGRRRGLYRPVNWIHKLI